MAKKTIEEFKLEMANCHPEIKVIGDYINNNTKIDCLCEADKTVFPVLPRNAKHIKVLCPTCRKNLLMDEDKFVQILNERFPNIELSGNYTRMHDKVEFRCKIDGYQWKAEPNTILNLGHGCPKCGGTVKITSDEFAQRFKDINDNIELLTSYNLMKNKIKCRCKIDDTIWEAHPENLLRGHGCPTCAAQKTSKRMNYTHEYFIDKVKQKTSTIEIQSQYVNSSSLVDVFCKICGYRWSTIANNLLQGKGCPKCGKKSTGEKLSKSHQEFLRQFFSLRKDITIIGEYINSSTKILCQCNYDNHVWEALPSNLLKGTGCPFCKTSKGENAVEKYLSEQNIVYFKQYRFDDCKNKRTLPFDFYLPECNTCVEYDGEQHFHPVGFGGDATTNFERVKYNDEIKNTYCKDHNINLIRIPYYNFSFINEILSSKLS